MTIRDKYEKAVDRLREPLFMTQFPRISVDRKVFVAICDFLEVVDDYADLDTMRGPIGRKLEILADVVAAEPEPVGGSGGMR